MSTNAVLNKEQVTQQVANVLLLYPELGDDEQLRHDMLEGCTSAFEYIETQLKSAAEKKAHLAGLTDYIKVLRERAGRIESQIEAHRSIIRKVMDMAQLTKLSLSVALVKIVSGRPSVIIKDINLLPDRCKKIHVDANKTEIAAMFAAGEQVPGAELSNGAPYLTVKFK